MQTTLSQAMALFTVAIILTRETAVAATDQNYDPSRIEGWRNFGGSGEAQELLRKQGFVVAAPAFSQIFEPYIQSPLPVFITVDSAWHTYHLLLEGGVKEMEKAQALRLARFSERLWRQARAQATNSVPAFDAIAEYASVGLAFQDQDHRAALSGDQQRLVAGLLDGASPVEARIGFPLSPLQFRAQSFYTESPELRAYYAARQWYANVVFRLSNPRETTLALNLSWLIESDSKLQDLWKELSEPYDKFVALQEDGTVTQYASAAKKILGSAFGATSIKLRFAEIQKQLEAQTPAPRINDQLLSPAEYSHFSKITSGFRLLPSRQLPCAVCFQTTVDPKIPGRLCPSGLDWFAASPVMRSPAAVRAVEGQFGNSVAEAVLKVDCGTMPDSLYGQSMELLAKLQQPLPSSAPAPLRTEAWADLQLWTQLGAWAEQRHTWALHAKGGALYAGGAEAPPGIVAPYPDFFAGLARLSRETAEAFDKTALQKRFDVKTVAAEMLELETLVRNNYQGMSQADLAKIHDKTEHYSRFYGRFQAKHRSEMTPTAWKVRNELFEMLKRCAETGQANQQEIETLRMYFDTRQRMPPLLNEFAGVCDRLAELARKQLAGEPLTRNEVNWVSDYGKTLASFHDYLGNFWLVPQDDFPIVSRIFHIPVNGTVLYSGVARPQALYVVLPYKDKLQLYRGAVLSYREFVRPENENLDDESWRKVVRENRAPVAPPFTQSFLRMDEPGADHRKRMNAFNSPFKPGGPPGIKLNVREVSLGASPTTWVWHEGWITPSHDCRHVAYRARGKGKWWIVRDGVAGREYDEAYYQSFSPNSEHLAYLARNGDKWFVVFDGAEGKSFARIGPTAGWPFVFSPDSTRLAYAATVEKGQECVMVDGIQGPTFERILPASFCFSDDSKHFAYAARRENKAIVIKDSKEVLDADEMSNDGMPHSNLPMQKTYGPYLSPEGQRLACFVRRGTNWFANVDGIEGKPWDYVYQLAEPPPGFSPRGQHFTYVAMRGEKYFVVVDQAEHEGSWLSCAVFSRDGKRTAFILADAKPGQSFESWVVLDGVAGKKFQGEIKDLVFSPDSRKLAYKVEDKFPLVVIHGGEEFEQVSPNGDLIFSPDSQHLAYVGRKGDRSVVVIDGQEFPKGDEAYDLHNEYFTFSPDSQRWAFISQRNEKHYAVVSGTEYGPYDYLGVAEEDAYIYFSPDSRHFAFMAVRGDQHYMVVDGFEHPVPGQWLTCSVLRFDSATNLHGLIMGKEHLARVEAEIEGK